jgi:hypothetical protein
MLDCMNSRVSLLRNCREKEDKAIYPDYRYNQYKLNICCLVLVRMQINVILYSKKQCSTISLCQQTS